MNPLLPHLLDNSFALTLIKIDLLTYSLMWLKE